jgi:hypothetical protein
MRCDCEGCDEFGVEASTAQLARELELLGWKVRSHLGNNEPDFCPICAAGEQRAPFSPPPRPELGTGEEVEEESEEPAEMVVASGGSPLGIATGSAPKGGVVEVMIGSPTEDEIAALFTSHIKATPAQASAVVGILFVVANNIVAEQVRAKETRHQAHKRKLAERESDRNFRRALDEADALLSEFDLPEYEEQADGASVRSVIDTIGEEVIEDAEYEEYFETYDTVSHAALSDEDIPF